MRSYSSKVKEYKRKKYTQRLINLKKDHPFSKDELVIIFPESEVNEYKGSVKSLKSTIDQYELTIEKHELLIKDLKESLEVNKGIKVEFNVLQDKYSLLLNEKDKLRNSYDHLQARFNKCQEELNTLERSNSDLRVAVAKVQKMSFFERVLNRLPNEVKQITMNKD